MNELVKVHYEDNNRPTVMGRELHDALEVGTPYRMWFPRMCEYGFNENVDYSTIVKNVRRQDGTLMPQTSTDHQLTLDMAKELCMIQRTEKGKVFRQYFIEVEKAWNSPEMVMTRALKIAQCQLDSVKAYSTSKEARTVYGCYIKSMQSKAIRVLRLTLITVLTDFNTQRSILTGRRKVDFSSTVC